MFQEAYSFPRAWLEKNCEVRDTDNVQGQISDHIFAPNGGYCAYYSSRVVLNIGENVWFPTYSVT